MRPHKGWASHSDFEREIAAIANKVIVTRIDGAGNPLLVTMVLTTFEAEYS